MEQEEPAAEETAADEAYPPPTITSPPLPEAAYPVGEETPTPAAAEEAYPAPEATEPTGTPLVLDKPIEVGTTLVEGSGPSGLRVVLVNVTQMGLELGSAVIGDDGRFAIEVDPLPAGVRIGLTADLGAAGLSEADVQPGDGEIAIPRVGYFFDSFVIPQ